MTKPVTTSGRALVAIIMGSIAFVLIVLLIVAARLPVAAGLLITALAGACLIAVWLAKRAASMRSAWGRGFLVNGLLSAAVAVSFRVQDEPWLGQVQYPNDLDRAIGPLTHFVWALVARAGLAALIVAAVLLGLSYWLLGPPHRKA